ncbi:Protein GLC8 [[Candida] zeylanoides]
MTRGILRNRNETSPTSPHGADASELDRREVIRNTRLNAQLTSAQEKTKGDILRHKIAEQKALDPAGTEEPRTASPEAEHLKWDELNLYKTEQEKCATMRIDEPKTPYEGGFNPNGEYYRDDDDIPGFELGEGEFDADATQAPSSLNGGEILRSPEADAEVEDDAEDSPPELSAEERHRHFEEMRKEHYHMKGNALKQGIQISDDEDEQ